MSSTSASPYPDGVFEAIVEGRSVELAFRNGLLYVDGERVDFSFERIGDRYFLLRLDGSTYPVVFGDADPSGSVAVTLGGKRSAVRVKDEKDLLLEKYGIEEGAGAGERQVRSPMPGLVLEVFVEEGQEVEAGEGLLVLEAMKMENELRAPFSGTVRTVHAASGEAVEKSALLIELE